MRIITIGFLFLQSNFSHTKDTIRIFEGNAKKVSDVGISEKFGKIRLPNTVSRRFGLLIIGVLLLFIQATVAHADFFAEDDRVSAIFGPITYHYSPSSKHNPFPWFAAIQWESASRWELGGALFRNSFYQPCGYFYGGKRWTAGSPDEHIFFKLTAGALVGYVKPYDKKIPVNADGFGLGIIPAVGYKYQRASTQFVILGKAGFLWTLGYDL